MVTFLFIGQLVTLFHLVQKKGHLIHVQPDDFLFMELGQLYQGRRIVLNSLVPVIVIVETFQGGNFAHDSPFLVHDLLVLVIETIFQVFHIFLKIRDRQLVQLVQFDILHRNPGKGRIFLMEEIKEHMQVIGIGDPGPGGCPGLDSAEKVSTEWRQVFYQIAQPQNVFPVYLFMV